MTRANRIRLAECRSGFSLLELSIVLIIIGLVTAGAVAGLGMIESGKRVSTNNKLDRIEDALMAYRTVYNRLPCPADASLAVTNGNYGVEAANGGTCTGGTPAANFSDATNGVVEGAVPFQALNLPADFMYDGWGRKFAYAVNYKVTATNAMLSQSLTDMCGISLTDAGGAAGARSNKGAIYTLLSYGPDGHGGFLKSGTRQNAGSTNTDEQTNCHCDSTATATTYAASYVQKDATQNPATYTDRFDDIVRFKERWQMFTFDDGYMTASNSACSVSHGIRIDGTMASQGLSLIGTADVNGDGIPDLLINGQNSGTGNNDLYVVFGQASRAGFTPDPFLLPTSLNGTNGFVLHGTKGSWTSALAGDFNGDGIQDLAVTSCDSGCNIYIVFGQSSGWPSSFNLSSLTTASNPKGIQIGGSWGYNSTAIGVGDITGATNSGHNIDDLFIGEANDTVSSQSNAGDAWVFFGNTTISSIATSTAALNGTNGVYIQPYRANAYVGGSFAVGDFNHDGIKDLAIGATSDGGGYDYIIWGKSSFASTAGTISLSALPANGSQGVEISDSAEANNVRTVFPAGDFNNDSIDDLFIYVGDCPMASCGAGTWNNGDMVVLFGSGSWPASKSFDLASINGTNGVFLGSQWETGSMGGGQSPSAADISGDSKQDALMASHYYNNGVPTQGMVFFGGSGPWSSYFNTNMLNGSNGFIFGGMSGSSANLSQAAGDVDGDGTKDYVLGDYAANSNTGTINIVKGGKTPYPHSGVLSSTDLTGSAGYGYQITGANAGDKVGSCAPSWVSNCGLYTGTFSNGSSSDIAVSAPGASPGGVSGAGSVYVIWGSTTLPATLSLSTVQ
jgi:prepilin-type N-terminal cleavage/methylation domain-containing protein